MYPNTYYRLVVKALIKNSEGRVLLVKETPGFMSFPGGGLDHGESPEEGLKREIREELGINDIKVGKLLHAEPIFLPRSDYWMTWLIYDVTLGSLDFKVSEDVAGVEFTDIKTLRGSDEILEEAIVRVVEKIDRNTQATRVGGLE